MASSAELKSRLKDIDEWLATGATSIVVDGVTTSISLSELRKERARIQQLLPSESRSLKPAAYRVNIGG